MVKNIMEVLVYAIESSTNFMHILLKVFFVRNANFINLKSGSTGDNSLRGNLHRLVNQQDLHVKCHTSSVYQPKFLIVEKISFSRTLLLRSFEKKTYSGNTSFFSPIVNFTTSTVRHKL